MQLLDEIPTQPGSLSLPKGVWPLAANALSLLSRTGIAMRYEVQTLLGQKYGMTARSKRMRNLFECYLLDEQLIEPQTFQPFRALLFTAVRLTPRAETLCQALGWPVVESEWTRLIRLHTGDQQPKHTGAVLAFTANARKRGWRTEVVPAVDNPHVFPDVMVEKDGQRIYVEVELHAQRYRKWRQVNRFQGFVALCAKSPLRCASLIRECQEVGAAGIATDLQTLYLEGKADPVGPLWHSRWENISGGVR